MVSTNTLIALFLVYWVIVSILDKKGILEKYNISTYGPVLMIRTVRGQTLLDILARPKTAWRIFANIGIVLMFLGMFTMFFIIVLSDVAMLASIGDSTLPEPSKFNEARNIFLIPGVNEFIPLTWGIIALLVTLVVHEFSHAILCRVENIRVKSMGILLAIVPIGGFAEPDEEELFGVTKEDPPSSDADITIGPIERRILGTEEEPVTKKVVNKKIASREQRARILAAGVMSNFVVALIAFTLFFGPVLGAIAPVSDTMITNVTSGSPAELAGLEDGMVITQIDDISIQKANDIILYMNNIEAGTIVQVHGYKDHELLLYDIEAGERSEDVLKGIYISEIVPGSSAEAIGLEAGMLITKIDGTPIGSSEDFFNFMNSTKVGQVISVETVSADQVLNENASAMVFEAELGVNPTTPTEKGFLGVSHVPQGFEVTSLGVSIGEFPAKNYLAALKSIPSMLTEPIGWIIILGLPIIGLSGEGFPGFSGQLAEFYSPVGWGEPLGIGIFWIANTLLWVGWLNFYVGLFNCLPAVPLDGGHVFRDYLHALVNRFIPNETKAKEISTAIAASFTLLILISFLFMIFGPYIVHGF